MLGIDAYPNGGRRLGVLSEPIAHGLSRHRFLVESHSILKIEDDPISTAIECLVDHVRLVARHIQEAPHRADSFVRC